MIGTTLSHYRITAALGAIRASGGLGATSSQPPAVTAPEVLPVANAANAGHAASAGVRGAAGGACEAARAVERRCALRCGGQPNSMRGRRARARAAHGK